MFADYREKWVGYPSLEQLNLKNKYIWYRVCMLKTYQQYYKVINSTLWCTAFLKDEYLNRKDTLRSCCKCFEPSKSLIITQDYCDKMQTLDKCLMDYRLKNQFIPIIQFINQNIAIKIDISDAKTLRVYKRIADDMLAKLPYPLTHNEKASMMYTLHFNILDAIREWNNFYSKEVLGLPF